MASAVRVLYPALAGSWQMSAGQIGLLYAAIPLGAALGALTSGQLAQTVRPGALMLATTVGSFVAIALFSLMPHWALGALCLALFGWLSAISYAAAVHPDSDPDAGTYAPGGLTVCGPRKTSPATPSARRCSAA